MDHTEIGWESVDWVHVVGDGCKGLAFVNSLMTLWVPKHTYLLITSWSRVLLEKLTGFQLVQKFPAFYVTRKFITAFISARH